MKKRSISAIAAVSILIVGIGIMLYPFWAQQMSSKKNQDAIEQYIMIAQKMTEQEKNARLIEYEKYNEQISRTENTEYLGKEMIGIVEIPKLDVQLPIYYGTEEEILQQGVGILERSSIPAPGESIHSVLCAHSGLPTLYAFDNIDQLATNDIIEVHILDRTYEYRVVDTKTVLPEDADPHLKLVPGKNLITLFSCTPYGINTHRLLVSGELSDIREEAIRLPEENDYLLFGGFIVFIAVLTAIIIKKIGRKGGTSCEKKMGN